MEIEDRSDIEEVKPEEPTKTTHEEENNSGSKLTIQVVSNTRPRAMSTSPPNVAGQLTIFYGGNVNVFDGIPEDKGREILHIVAAMAASVKSGEMNKVGPAYQCSSPLSTESLGLKNTANGVRSLLAQLNPAQESVGKLQAEFPIARRHSLQRFLEKRRDRLLSKNPNPSSTKEMDEGIKSDISAQTSTDSAA